MGEDDHELQSLFERLCVQGRCTEKRRRYCKHHKGKCEHCDQHRGDRLDEAPPRWDPRKDMDPVF